MKIKNVELKVGIFVILAVLILSLGYLWIKETKFKSRGYTITIDFNDATGLKIGDPIRVLGVDKGKVLSITLLRDKVTTKCYLDADIELKKDARASIKDIALISGTKYIELYPGTAQESFDLSKHLLGIGSPSFSLGQLGDILEPIRKIAEKFSMGDIEKTLDNINVVSQELAELVKENRKGVRRTVTSAEVSLNNISKTAEKLNQSLEMLSQSLKGLNEGKGTMGKLLKDEKVYNELESTLKETKALLKDIRENPKRYINIKVF